jgi:hypothetical protein
MVKLYQEIYRQYTHNYMYVSCTGTSRSCSNEKRVALIFSFAARLVKLTTNEIGNFFACF